MTKLADVTAMLFARCDEMESEDLAVAFPEPDQQFVPPADRPYLRVDFFSNAPRWEGLTAGRMDQGLLQVTVVWPRQQGVIRAQELAGCVTAKFPKGLTLENGRTRVKVSREPYAASPLSDDTSLTIPVTIPWVA